LSWQTVLTVLTALTVVAGSQRWSLSWRSSAPFAAETYFNAKERLRTTQAAGERTGMFWPARAFFRDIITDKIAGGTQKVRGRSRPTAAFRHEFADANCQRIRLDDAFDCCLAVRIRTRWRHGRKATNAAPIAVRFPPICRAWMSRSSPKTPTAPAAGRPCM
jgi:hypothetical protein